MSKEKEFFSMNAPLSERLKEDKLADASITWKDVAKGVGGRVKGGGVSIPADVVGAGAFAAQMAFCREEEQNDKILCKGLRGIETVADRLSEAVQYPVTKAVDWVAERIDGKKPNSEVGMAVAEHLESSGMSHRDALRVVAEIEPTLVDHLAKNEHQGYLSFHKEGSEAVTMDAQKPDLNVNKGTISLEMATLQSIYDTGMPKEGAELIRNNLAEAKGVSNLQLVEHFGYDFARDVEKHGFPHQEVANFREIIQEKTGEQASEAVALLAVSQASREIASAMQQAENQVQAAETPALVQSDEALQANTMPKPEMER